MRDHSLAQSSGSLLVKLARTDSTSSRLAWRKVLRLPARSRIIVLISSKFFTRPIGASFGVVQAIQEVLAALSVLLKLYRRLFHVGTDFKRDIFSSLIRSWRWSHHVGSAWI